MRIFGRTSTRDDVSCRELVTAITAYLDDELEPARRTAVQRHLADCDGCAHVIDQFQRTIGAVGSISTDDVEALGDTVRAELMSAFRLSRRGSD